MDRLRRGDELKTRHLFMRACACACVRRRFLACSVHSTRRKVAQDDVIIIIIITRVANFYARKMYERDNVCK